MAVKVAINGYGRIGRNIMRALYESGRTDEITIVAINDLGDANSNAHLTQYDTAHGTFPGTVSVDDGDLVVNGDRIKVYQTRFTAMYNSISGHDIPTAMKLICLDAKEKVIGCHMIGPAVDEMLQGFAVAIRMGACKKDFDDTVAIHPTSAEELVTMR